MTTKKKILILSSTPRKNGNSEIMAKEFASGAQEAGHTVTFIALREKNIGFCQGCLACQKTHSCVILDDANSIVTTLRDVDVVVFATPIYYYTLCGQLKTLLDRTNPLYPVEYAFRDVYLLAAAADGRAQAIDGAVTALQGWINCFSKTTLKGVIRGVGLTHPGDASKARAILTEANTAGRNV